MPLYWSLLPLQVNVYSTEGAAVSHDAKNVNRLRGWYLIVSVHAVDTLVSGDTGQQTTAMKFPPISANC